MVEPVRTRRAFTTLSDSRIRGRSGPVWIVRADSDADSDAVHVAYAIGRVVGGAVVRNRVRRRLRSLVTDLDRQRALTPGLYLVGVEPPAATTSYADLAGHLERAVAGIR